MPVFGKLVMGGSETGTGTLSQGSVSEMATSLWGGSPRGYPGILVMSIVFAVAVAARQARMAVNCHCRATHADMWNQDGQLEV